jgi:hypothetical protein
MQWGFHLATKPTGTPLPNFAEKTTPVMTDAESAENIWIRDMAERPTEPDGNRWTILTGKQRTKPQLQSFITDSIQLVAYRYDTSSVNAVSSMNALRSGLRIKPSAFGIYTFAWPDEAANWLCAGVGFKQDGFIYRVSIRLIYSNDGWDTGVYQEYSLT